MPFNSINFFLFFVSVLVINYSVSIKYRWILGLMSSVAFYAIIDFKSIGLLIFSSYIDYIIGRKIESNIVTRKKKLLIISIVLNISLIFGFKYFNLFNTTLLQLINIYFDDRFTITPYNILIPVGISFYCFKKISYVVDVYRGITKPEYNFGYFLLYTAHFLEILSGPIDRSKNLLPQIRQPLSFEVKNFMKGVMLVLWGLFMKVTIADRLSIYTDPVFNNVLHHNGPSLLFAAYFYSFQIYCDFAGYTYIAIGCGKMLGLELAPNFNLPYFSSSISDFWRRWHMTLSFWFRDYLYIPLGGSRVSIQRRYFNIMVVFLLCGLWHGSNWTFVVWGALHGFFIVLELVTKNTRLKITNMLKIPAKTLNTLQIIITFNLVTFGWIFFRANSLHDAHYVITHLFSNWPNIFLDLNSMAYGLLSIIVLMIVEYIKFRKKLSIDTIFQMPTAIRWSLYYLLIFSIILTGVSSDSAFIYYQF